MQEIVFRTPDWQDGYGDGLLTRPPPERTARLAPGDRSAVVALLLACARETIASVGWCAALDEYRGRNLSPLIWRATPATDCRWAGHVWDACAVGDDGAHRLLLRLVVLFVDWRVDDEPIWGDHLFSRLPQGTDPVHARPYLSPYIEDGDYCLIDGDDIHRPVTLETGRAAADRIENVPATDRAALEDALRDAVIQRLNGNSSWVWSRTHAETDSHFGRWYHRELKRLQADAGKALQWDWNPEALPRHRAAYDAAMANGSVPAVLPSTVAGSVTQVWTRSHPYDRGHGSTLMRLTVKDVEWEDGRVVNLDCDQEPRLIDRRQNRTRS